MYTYPFPTRLDNTDKNKNFTRAWSVYNRAISFIFFVSDFCIQDAVPLRFINYKCYKSNKGIQFVRNKRKWLCISGGKKSSFFGKFSMLCFLVRHALRFAFLLYYKRFITQFTWIFKWNRKSKSKISVMINSMKKTNVFYKKFGKLRVILT